MACLHERYEFSDCGAVQIHSLLLEVGVCVAAASNKSQRAALRTRHGLCVEWARARSVHCVIYVSA
jgi:hypothetical protein